MIITTCVDGLAARRPQNARAVRIRKMHVGQVQNELPGASVDERDSGEASEDLEPFRWLIGAWHGHCLVAAESTPSTRIGTARQNMNSCPR